MLYENGEFERIRPHLTPLECGIIFDGIPEGAISRKVGLIWGIPARYCSTVSALLFTIYLFPRQFERHRALPDGLTLQRLHDAEHIALWIEKLTHFDALTPPLAEPLLLPCRLGMWPSQGMLLHRQLARTTARRGGHWDPRPDTIHRRFQALIPWCWPGHSSWGCPH